MSHPEQDLEHQCIPISTQILEYRIKVTFNPSMSIITGSSRYKRTEGMAATIAKGVVVRCFLHLFVGLRTSAVHLVMVSPSVLSVVRLRY